MEGETGSNRTHFPDLIQINVNLSCPTSYVAQSAEQLHLITLKESYSSSNPGRVDFFLSSILIARLVCIFISITIGPLFCLFIFCFFIIVYIYICIQISIQQIHKPSVSLAVSESDVRSNIIGL